MKLKLILGGIVLIGLGYFLGPKPSSPKIVFELNSSQFPKTVNAISPYLAIKESKLDIRPENQSIIQWANPDSISKTEYSLVYLHGFSASPEEGLPVHKNIAREYGMNLYAPLLAHHGIETKEPLQDFSSKAFIESAYEAIKIGELMGEKVIVMSCSTGGTASLYCAAYSDTEIHAQILYSPNIRLSDSKSSLLSKPWGLQLARLVKGGKYHEWEIPGEAKKYWYGKYRLEALVDLQCALENLMVTSTFKKVMPNSMIAYYFKDQTQQDDVVSVEAIKNMISELGTEKSEIYEVVFAGVKAHALQSEFFSQDIESVIRETKNYLENHLAIKKPL